MLYVIQWQFSSSQCVTLKIVPEHEIDYQKAIILFSNVGCLCMISFKIETLNSVIGFHKGMLFDKIGMVAENE